MSNGEKRHILGNFLKRVSENAIFVIVSSTFFHQVELYKYLRAFSETPFAAYLRVTVKKPPWVVRGRKGSEITIQSREQLFKTLFANKHPENFIGDNVVKEFDNGTKVVLRSGNNNEKFKAFINDDYLKIPVKERTQTRNHVLWIPCDP